MIRHDYNRNKCLHALLATTLPCTFRAGIVASTPECPNCLASLRSCLSTSFRRVSICSSVHAVTLSRIHDLQRDCADLDAWFKARTPIHLSTYIYINFLLVALIPSEAEPKGVRSGDSEYDFQQLDFKGKHKKARPKVAKVCPEMNPN